MPDELLVRPVARSDHEQWLPLWDGYNAFYGRSGPTALSPEITRMTWARFFDAYEPVHALVAESDGRLVGLAHYLFHRSTTAIEPVCYLQDLFTDASARGRGIGGALISELYELAPAGRDAARILANASDQSHRASALRQARRTVRLHRLSQGILTGKALFAAIHCRPGNRGLNISCG